MGFHDCKGQREGVLTSQSFIIIFIRKIYYVELIIKRFCHNDTTTDLLKVTFRFWH